MDDKKVLLSVRDLHVKFRVRGRILTAIRGIDLDIYENESIAIVGESGSGKSVFTKTFAGMLDSNGFISEGQLIFSDDELADTHVGNGSVAHSFMKHARASLDASSRYEFGAKTWQEMERLKSERAERMGLSHEEQAAADQALKELTDARTNLFNQKQTLDPKHQKAEIRDAAAKLKDYDRQIKEMKAANEAKAKAHKAAAKSDAGYEANFQKKMAELKARYEKEIATPVTKAQTERNEILAKEIYLSIGRYGFNKRLQLMNGLLKALKKAMVMGVDLDNENERNKVFDTVAFRVKYLDETEEKLHGTCILNLANVKYAKDWNQIRGRRIATVFQDPMTSLNPIVTIGKQITSVIVRHQGCSEAEARRRAIELMHKVGIPHAEQRFDDYPFQYSGGMRQRIVIAIALSCQPKILICDEPTTALDVTIQAQILKLIKDLQKEFGYTIVFITHDLGVVANIADRVAVLYAGQVIELGNVDEVFYDPHHPYTWALLSSLPQLAQSGSKLYSITGTPPSLYNSIVGDAFAPRNPFCLKIDTLEEPPMFKVTETHSAKTWLLDPRAPKIEKPEGIRNIHEKILGAYNIEEI